MCWLLLIYFKFCVKVKRNMCVLKKSILNPLNKVTAMFRVHNTLGSETSYYSFCLLYSKSEKKRGMENVYHYESIKEPLLISSDKPI